MQKSNVSNRPVTRNYTDFKKNEKTIEPDIQICVLGITLDATLSFSRIYPHIFFFLKEMLEHLKEKKKYFTAKKMCYCITLLHNTPETYFFEDGAIYCSDEDKVINALSGIDFYDGGKEGKENFTESINHQLQVLHSYPHSKNIESIQKAMVFFTDSMPEDDNSMPDFSCNASNQYGNYVNEGLRFAKFYTYDDGYMPALRIVNQRGKLTENKYNVCECESISEILEKNQESTKLYAQSLAQKILDGFLEG